MKNHILSIFVSVLIFGLMPLDAASQIDGEKWGFKTYLNARTSTANISSNVLNATNYTRSYRLSAAVVLNRPSGNFMEFEFVEHKRIRAYSRKYSDNTGYYLTLRYEYNFRIAHKKLDERIRAYLGLAYTPFVFKQHEYNISPTSSYYNVKRFAFRNNIGLTPRLVFPTKRNIHFEMNFIYSIANLDLLRDQSKGSSEAAWEETSGWEYNSELDRLTEVRFGIFFFIDKKKKAVEEETHSRTDFNQDGMSSRLKSRT